VKKATIQLSFDSEKLDAIKHYTTEKGVDLQAELNDALQSAYTKYVPKEVRAYLEIRSMSEPPRPRRAVRQAEISANTLMNDEE